MRAIGGLWEDLWCIGGDFNVVRFPKERRNYGRISSNMRSFSNFIQEFSLVDLTLSGGSFTWCGGQNKQSMLRIDCFLLTSDQEEHFSNTMQTILPRPVSDHSPIPLEGGRVRRSKTPFRFENMWLKVDGFKDLVKGWSEGYQFSGSSNFIFQAEGVEGRHQSLE